MCVAPSVVPCGGPGTIVTRANTLLLPGGVCRSPESIDYPRDPRVAIWLAMSGHVGCSFLVPRGTPPVKQKDDVDHKKVTLMLKGVQPFDIAGISYQVCRFSAFYKTARGAEG